MDDLKKIEVEIKESIKSFPENSIIRNLFWCEIVVGLGNYVFRGATLTKEGAEYLGSDKGKLHPNLCGIQWWAVPLETNLSKLERFLKKHFAKKDLKWGVPPKFLDRWRQ